jgi:homoprotocatechuate degradation regulator HpaR
MTHPSLRLTRRSLPIALLRARETVMGPIREFLAQSGINEQGWRVLRVLDERGPLELSILAQEACLLLPSLTRIARNMETEGLITRETPPEDRRKAVVTLAPKGRAIIDRHAGESAAYFARLQSEFGAERLEELLDLLEQLQRLDLRPRRDV